MAYISIDNFAAGMDRRRKRVAGAPGSLWTCKNAHISRGGDIQRSRKFDAEYALPAGSRYLSAVRGQLYTFGSADLAATTPVGMQYQRLRSGRASGTLTITSGQNAGNTETVVIGSKTYTFQTALTNVDGNVLIGADRNASLTNLANAVNLGTGAGTLYATLMTINASAFAQANGDGTMTVTAKADGTAGNSVATTETLAQGSFTSGATLASGGGATLTKILDAKPFQGLLYVIAEYNDGNIHHFYNATRVSDWDLAVAADYEPERVAERLAVKLSGDEDVTASVFGAVVTVTARVPGTAFTIDSAAVNVGVDTTQAIADVNIVANVAGVAETLATATVEVLTGSSDPGTDSINSITVDGAEIMDGPVDWSGSNAATAIRVAASINNGTATHNYSASTADEVVTISAAPGTGDSVNGDVVAVEVSGSVTVDADAAMAGGVDAVTAVAQVETVTVSGTIEGQDKFTVTINGTNYIVTGQSAVMGTSAYVDKQRIFSPAGTLWRYCMLATPTVWDPANATVDNDAGFLSIAEETEGTETLTVATRYQNRAAVISQSFISLWTLDSDPANFALTDTLDNIGTASAHSVIRYGNNDVFFLDTTGVRSLRARDASNAAFVSDVGNAIDTFVQETLDTLTPEQVLDAVAAIEPKDGRLWLAAGGYIFVLSFFPSDKISAWSYYQPDEFDDETVETIVRAGKELYVRAGDTVFRYGEDYNDADVSAPLVELPFLSANDPATFKEFKGYDMACVGDWAVEVLYDPNNEARTINIGTITETTFNELGIDLSGNTTMVALKLTGTGDGEATISSIQLHFDKIKE